MIYLVDPKSIQLACTEKCKTLCGTYTSCPLDFVYPLYGVECYVLVEI